jgi:hypothetical protein
MIEFAFNACILTSIDIFSFLANYEFESRISFDLVFKNLDDSTRQQLLRDKKMNIDQQMQDI